MIISHQHKFIFLKTHKTAGTSLQIALSRSCGKEDIISKLHADDMELIQTNNGKNLQNDEVSFTKYGPIEWLHYLVKGRKQYFTEHLDAKRVKKWIGSCVWDSYYKFCFERNPYDKVISYYYWRTRNSSISFESFLEQNLDALSDFMIYTLDEHVAVDEVYRYEDMDAAIASLERRLNISIPMKSIKAKSSHKPKKQDQIYQLTSEDKSKINRAFKKEIKLFYPELLVQR